MGTFGKVLLGLNLLAMGGFVYLGLQDWRGRQTVAAAGLRSVLLRDGLPLGDRPKTDSAPADPDGMPTEADAEIPFRVVSAGGALTETVGPELLKAYFAQAGGGAAVEGRINLAGTAPVPNQMAEVRRVRPLVEGGAAGKPAVLRPILERLAETLDERLEVQALGGNADELYKRLGVKFDQVLGAAATPDLGPLAAAADGDPPAAPPAPPAAPRAEASDADKQAYAARLQTYNADMQAYQQDHRAYQERVQQRVARAAELQGAAVKDEPERRARLAHLLVHLDTDPAWQKRAAMVVGVRQYAQTVAAQADRLRAMGDRVTRLMADDQSRFDGQYNRLRDLAIQGTQTVRDTAENRARLEVQVTRDEAFNAQRLSDLTELQAQFTRVRAEVNDLLARQKVVEDQLFGAQREVGLALDEIYRLADELDRLERQRYGKK